MAVFKDDFGEYGVYIKQKDDIRVPFKKVNKYSQNYGSKKTREEAENDMEDIIKTVHRGAWYEIKLG